MCTWDKIVVVLLLGCARSSLLADIGTRLMFWWISWLLSCKCQSGHVFLKSQQIGKQCNYFNYFDCWKVEGAVNLEDVEDSVEKQPSLVGELEKNQQDWLGESLENSNCNLARWKGNVQRRKRRTPGFSHLPAFFSMENLIRWTIRFP